jgi:3-dehydrosphinganine reductase
MQSLLMLLQVQDFVASLRELPSSLFCVAGGTAEEVGFFADITTDQIFSCFQKNYFSSAYITHALLQRWLEKPADPAVIRHIAFTGSTAAFVAVPGYIAYTPTKTALRALADTLRQEVLLYKAQQTIQVHCSYPGTITTETLADEQKRKPELCKLLEGSEDPKNCMTPEAVATGIVAGVERGDFCIIFDFETNLLLNNMRGPSPPNTYVWDWILGFIVSLVWPFFRRSWDRTTVQYGLKHKVK